MRHILENKNLLIDAFEFWGKEAQEGMLHEEVGELMQALNK